MKKPLPVTAAEEITAALAEVNGRATSHTFTYASDVQHLALEAEKRLDALHIPKAARAGAVFIGESGERLPNAYKYAAQTTTVTLVRKGKGWFVRHIARSSLYSRQTPTNELLLTPEQDALAVAAFRRAYKVVAPQAQPVAATVEA